MLWNVLIHMVRATGPTRSPMRSFISPAALLVNVMATTSSGRTCCTWMSHATRCVSTRVLPEPAPARISRGPSTCVTALRCSSLRPASSGWSGCAGPPGLSPAEPFLPAVIAAPRR